MPHRRFAHLIAALAVALIGGCTSLPEQVEQQALEEGGDRIAALAAVTQRDVEAALEAANATDDTIGAACWSVLGPWLDRFRLYRRRMEELEATGTAYALRLQRARTIRRFLSNPPDDLVLGCAPLLDDGGGFLGGLVRRLGLP